MTSISAIHTTLAGADILVFRSVPSFEMGDYVIKCCMITLLFHRSPPVKTIEVFI